MIINKLLMNSMNMILKSKKILQGRLIYCAVILLSPVSVYSHTIILKDLTVVYGIVYKQDSDNVYFNSDKGQKFVPKSKVGKILIQDVKENDKLKILIKKVKTESDSENSKDKIVDVPKPSGNLKDIEVENVKYLIEEIEEEERQDLKKEAMFRSFVFPGWGLIHSGSPKIGYSYATAFIASLGAVIYTSIDVNRKQTNYLKTNQKSVENSFILNPQLDRTLSLNLYLYSSDLSNKAFAEKNQAITQQRVALFSLVGIYLAQILHTYISTPSLSIDNKEDEERQSGFFMESYQEQIPYSSQYDTKTNLEYRLVF